MRHLLILLALPLLALDNSMTKRNFNGTGVGEARHTSSTLQTARPFTDHRIFAQGEIASYPKPNGITPWQSDVKSRWRDGSVARPCSAAAAHVSGQVLMTCTAHGFRNTETVVIAGNATLNGTYQAVVISPNTFVLKAKTYSDPGTLTGVTATGPTYGSVREAFVSYKANVPANGNLTVDYVNDSNPCSSGNQAACDAAGLDQSGMLAFNGAAWNVKIEATAAATTYGVDARTMLAAGEWFYRLRGPVVTQVVVEDGTTARSFGWHLVSTVMTVDAGTQYKSLNPRYVLTFYTGWSGVKTESILENPWSTRWQDQVYNVAVKTGAALGTTAYSKSAFRHTAGARWRKIFWDGTTPGDVVTDYNFDYLIYSKAIMPYLRAAANAPTENAITCYYSDRHCFDDTGTNWPYPWTLTDKGDIGGAALWWSPDGPAMDMGNGAEEAGVLQGFDVTRLMGSDSRMEDVIFGFGVYDAAAGVAGGGGNAAANGSAPWHERSTANDATWCRYTCIDNPTTSTRNRLPSLDAYPTNRNNTETAVGDTVWGGWGFDASHAQDTAYAPWLMTGDYYLLEELWFWSFKYPFGGNEGNASYHRHGQWGIVNQRTELRSQAWGIRQLTHTAFASPDGSPEEEYFRKKLENHFAVEEGFFGITDGLFGPGYPCTTSYAPTFNATLWTQTGFNVNNQEDCSRWYWGIVRVGSGDPVNWYDPDLPPYNNFLKMPTNGNTPANTGDGGLNTARVVSQEGTIQEAYWSAAIALAKRMGYSFANALVASHFQLVVDLSAHPAMNPAMMSAYRMPAKMSNRVISITSCVAGNPTVCLASAHGLVGATVGSTCCSSWGTLNRPTTMTSWNHLTATPTDANHLSFNADTTGSGSWNGSDVFELGVGPSRSPNGMAEFKAGFLGPNRTILELVGYPNDLSGQYQMYPRGAAVLAADMGITTTRTVDGYSGRRTGERAYDWWRGNTPYQDMLNTQKRWALVPSAIRNVVVTPAAISVVLQWDDVDGGGSTIAVSATPFATSSDSGDTAVAGGKRRKTATVTGLTGGTTYYYRITHGADRVSGTFVTN